MLDHRLLAGCKATIPPATTRVMTRLLVLNSMYGYDTPCSNTPTWMSTSPICSRVMRLICAPLVLV